MRLWKIWCEALDDHFSWNLDWYLLLRIVFNERLLYTLILLSFKFRISTRVWVDVHDHGVSILRSFSSKQVLIIIEMNWTSAWTAWWNLTSRKNVLTNFGLCTTWALIIFRSSLRHCTTIIAYMSFGPKSYKITLSLYKIIALHWLNFLFSKLWRCSSHRCLQWFTWVWPRIQWPCRIRSWTTSDCSP